jgi:tellurite resistance protein
MSRLNLPDLEGVDANALAVAVGRVIQQQTRDAAAPSIGPRTLSGRLPSVASLDAGATSFVRASSEDAGAARHFLALLEAAYLVAVSDGVAAAERSAFAGLLAQATANRATAETLASILSEFDSALEREGRAARLADVAARFSDFVAREEALSFATLVTVADGAISRKEARGLIELSEALGFSIGELQLVLEQVGGALKAALTGSG